MTGKDKCKILGNIRKQIAEENDIEWIVRECRHQGECRGTCPRCESEVRKLEREIDLRRRIGKKVALIGISAACLAGLAGCGPDVSPPLGGDFDGATEIIEPAPVPPELDGDVIDTDR